MNGSNHYRSNVNFSQIRCKTRVYKKGDKLYKKRDFIPHCHESQAKQRLEFEVEYNIKKECSDLAMLVNASSQTSAVADIFLKHIKL